MDPVRSGDILVSGQTREIFPAEQWAMDIATGKARRIDAAVTAGIGRLLSFFGP